MVIRVLKIAAFVQSRNVFGSGFAVLSRSAPIDR